MVGKIKKHQRSCFAILIVLCIGIIVGGGLRYLQTLRDNLEENALQDVMNVTLQQRQAFDSFISSDREQLHGYAEYLPKTPRAARRRSGGR